MKAGSPEEIQQSVSSKAAEGQKTPPAKRPKPKKSDQEIAANRETIEALHTKYEEDIAKLMATERSLLIDRLVELRSTAASDVPHRFGARMDELAAEADKMLAKLEKYFEKERMSAKKSVDDQVADAELIGTKAVARVKGLAGDATKEVQAYGSEHRGKEEQSILRAYGSVETLTGKAQVRR